MKFEITSLVHKILPLLVVPLTSCKQLNHFAPSPLKRLSAPDWYITIITIDIAFLVFRFTLPVQLLLFHRRACCHSPGAFTPTTTRSVIRLFSSLSSVEKHTLLTLPFNNDVSSGTSLSFSLMPLT